MENGIIFSLYKEKMAALERFPPDLLRYIAQVEDLPTRDIIQLCRTNREINNAVCNNRLVWEYLFRKRLSEVLELASEVDIKRELYQLDLLTDVRLLMNWALERGYEVLVLANTDQIVIEDLVTAVKYNHPHLVEILLNIIPATDQQNILERALYVAAEYDSVDVFPYLEEIDPDIFQDELRSLFDRAIDSDSLKIVNYLMEKYPVVLQHFFEENINDHIVRRATIDGAVKVFREYFPKVTAEFNPNVVLESSVDHPEIVLALIHRYGNQIGEDAYIDALNAAVRSEDATKEVVEALLEHIPEEAADLLRIRVRTLIALRAMEERRTYTPNETLQLLYFTIHDFDEDMMNYILDPDFSGYPQTAEQKLRIFKVISYYLNRTDFIKSNHNLVEKLFALVSDLPDKQQLIDEAIVMNVDPAIIGNRYRKPTSLDIILPYLSNSGRIALLVSDYLGGLRGVRLEDIQTLKLSDVISGDDQAKIERLTTAQWYPLLRYLDKRLLSAIFKYDIRHNEELQIPLLVLFDQDDIDRIYLEMIDERFTDNNLTVLASPEARQEALTKTYLPDDFMEMLQENVE